MHSLDLRKSKIKYECSIITTALEPQLSFHNPIITKCNSCWGSHTIHMSKYTQCFTRSGFGNPKLTIDIVFVKSTFEMLFVRGQHHPFFMMASSKGNIFRVTGLLCGEFTEGQWCGPSMFSLICALNKRLSKQSWGWWFETPSCSLWRHCRVVNGCSSNPVRPPLVLYNGFYIANRKPNAYMDISY